MKHQVVYGGAAPFVELEPNAAALFFPIDYEFMEEKPKEAQDLVRGLLEEEFGNQGRIRTHEVNLGYGADWHAVLAFLAFVMVPSIAAYIDLGERLIRVIDRIMKKGDRVVYPPRLTLHTFLALAANDAVSKRGADRESLKVDAALDFPDLKELDGKLIDYAEHVFVTTLSDMRQIYHYSGCSSEPYIRLAVILQKRAARQAGWRIPLVEQIAHDEPKDEN